MSTQILSCTSNIHPYVHICRQIRYSVPLRKKVSSLFRYKHTHAHTLCPLPPPPCPPTPTTTTHTHWTGQLDGLLGTMERLYKKVGFEVSFKGSKGRRLMDCKWKRVPDSRSLLAERVMFKRLEFFFGFFSEKL